MDFSSSQEKKKLKEISPIIAKEELIRRLKLATKVLSNVDQEDETLTEFNEFAASVASPFILEHKDRDVKSYAACCLADILRIYAPEPPYHKDALLRIFCMILEQLKYLRDVEAPSYKRYFYVLESLALVKTFNVCIELDAQDVILNIFKLFFTLISEQQSVRVKSFMLDIMCSLIQEGESISQELLDTVLINFVPPNKKRSPESYYLASSLIERCSSNIEPYIQIFFNKVMVMQDSVGSVLEDHLYPLIYELFKINKTVLLSVIPQLEYRLKSNEESERVKTVRLLSLLFLEEDSSMVKCNKSLWQCYLGRFSDISSGVRLECIKSTKQFLFSKDDLVRDDMTEQLTIRLQDPDETVRLETVTTICKVASEDFELLSEKLFDGVIERIMDKKWQVRRETVSWIGKIYKRLFGNLSKKAMKYVSQIPLKILNLYQQNNVDDKLMIERVIYGCLIPVTLPTEKRMRRLFSLYFSLDNHSIQIFNAMLKQKSKINNDFTALLDAYNKESDKKCMSVLIGTLAKNLPDPQKAQIHISKLFDMCKNKNLLKLLSTSCSVKEGCSVVIKCVSEIVKTITINNPAIETVKALLDRSCPMLIDETSFNYLLNNVKNHLNDFGDEDDEDDDMLVIKGKCGLKLIEFLSTIRPSLFQSEFCFEVLMNLLTSEDEEVIEKTLKILLNIIHLKEDIGNTFPESLKSVLQNQLTKGSSKQAKYSLRLLNLITNEDSLEMEKIFDGLLEDLNIDTLDTCLQCTFIVFSEISLFYPWIFEKHYSKVIRDLVVKKVLMKNQEKTEDADEDEWADENEISVETKVKISAIKLLTKWLLGLQDHHKERSKPVLELLIAVLQNDGDLVNDGKISAKNRSHLRLASSLSLLKLAQNCDYVNLITVDQYSQLALTIQDSCYEVREKFTLKLNKALDALRLSLDYLAYFVLVAADPVRERRQKVKQMLIKNTQNRREFIKLNSAFADRPFAVLPEYSLPYVIYILAHHPDFVHTDMNSLIETKDYLWFYLEPILGTKGDNYSFIKKLFESMKQTKDAQDPDNKVANERIYIVCDLAIGCVMCKNQNFNLKDFPGKVVLPKKLYQFDRNLNNTKIYIPDDLFVPQKKKPLLDIKVNTPKKSSKPKRGMGKKKAPLLTCPDGKNTENYELVNIHGTRSRPKSSSWWNHVLKENDESETSFVDDA